MGIGHLFRSTALSKDAPWRFGEPLPTRCTSLHLEGLRPSDVNPVTKWTHPAGVHSQKVPTGVGFTQTERRRRRGLGKGRARQRFLFREHEKVPGTDGGGGWRDATRVFNAVEPRAFEQGKDGPYYKLSTTFFFFFFNLDGKTKTKNYTHTYTHKTKKTRLDREHWLLLYSAILKADGFQHGAITCGINPYLCLTWSHKPSGSGGDI